jgi:hypothetical protein
VAPKAAGTDAKTVIQKDHSEEDDDGSDLADSDDDNGDTYGKVDVGLRESLRVLDDAIELGRNHDYWAADHAPLTAMSKS